jgi:hypothetical protein
MHALSNRLLAGLVVVLVASALLLVGLVLFARRVSGPRRGAKAPA